MIGQRIKEYRESIGLKVIPFANKIGIAQSTLSAIETGKSKPSAETLAQIIRNTDIDAVWLITGETRGGGKKEGTINLALLKQAIEAAEQGLDATNRVMSPANKAGLISVIYELFIKNESELKAENIIKFITAA